MAPLKLARHAMATRFEMVLPGENITSLRAAGEEALEEIARLEDQLSLYRPISEIAHLNALAARQPVRVTPGLFALLQHAKRLHAESRGAFDITIGPLVRCWGFMGGTGRLPRADELAEARACVGMHLVELHPADFTVRFLAEGVILDLGAIGKGYAIERAVEVLREAGVTSALVHGGTSTIYGLGHPPDAEFWNVAIDRPTQTRGFRLAKGSATAAAEQERDGSAAPLATIPLKDEAMSVSAVWGRSFQAEGRSFGHVLDPRTGQPVTGAVLSAVVLPSATETDALSTALLTLGPQGQDIIANLRPGMRTLLVNEAEGQLHAKGNGITVHAS